MRIGIIGTNHNIADIKYREKLAKIFHKHFHSTKSRSANHNSLLLSTCNRTEVYFSSDNLEGTYSYLINVVRDNLDDKAEIFHQKLYSYFGEECFRHLSRVTTGLDSSIVAETEIQGQVKAAYEAFSIQGTLNSELHYLFQRSLKIGKSIRSELFLNSVLPKIEHAIHNAVTENFDWPEKKNVLFVGASDINRKILSYLRLKNYENITLCNRSADAASNFADKFGLSLLDWKDLNRWHEYDIIIFGTKSQNYLITKEEFNKLPSTKNLVIDLCIPRNVAPSLGSCPQISLLDIDRVNTSLKVKEKQMIELVEQAESIVEASTKREITLFSEKQARASFFVSGHANYCKI